MPKNEIEVTGAMIAARRCMSFVKTSFILSLRALSEMSTAPWNSHAAKRDINLMRQYLKSL